MTQRVYQTLAAQFSKERQRPAQVRTLRRGSKEVAASLVGAGLGSVGAGLGGSENRPAQVRTLRRGSKEVAASLVGAGLGSVGAGLGGSENRPAQVRTLQGMQGLVAALGILAFALSILTACGPPSAPRWPDDNSLTVALGNAPTNLDPRVGTDQASGRVAQLLYNGLVTTNAQGNLIPDLATSWEVLDDGHRYRFHLRPGVTFHDGRALTSEDVLWTYGSILDDTVITAKKAAFNVVEKVVAVNPLTVDLVLYEPYGPLLADLTPAQGIIPAGITTEEMNRHPIGTGPFQFLARSPETVTLGANPQYYDGPPRLDRVIFKEVPDSTVRALELLSGSVQLVINDLAPDVVPMFRKNPHFQVVESPGAIYAYLGINMEDPILSDVRVRRALALSIDRQRLVDTLWQGLGVVTETILPPGLWARNDELAILPHDPQESQRLLEEAGYPDPDGDGPLPRLTLTYKTSTNEPYVLQAQVIQAMAKEAGIDIVIRSYEFATFYADVKKGNFQIFALQRTGVVDPNIYRMTLHSASIPPAGQNRGRYSNQEFDRLIDQGAALTLPEDRRPFYLRAQEILAEELPYISLYTKDNYAVLPAPITGYQNYPSGEVFSLRGVGWGDPDGTGPEHEQQSQ